MQFESPFRFPTIEDRLHEAAIEEIRQAGYKPEYLKEEINKEVYEEAVAYNYINEASIKRSEVSDKDFGVPSQKKFPMPDEKHVRSAIRFFNYVDKEHEEELARNIKKKMKQYKITDISVGKKNRFSKYYQTKKAVNEAYHGEPNSHIVFESVLFDNDKVVTEGESESKTTYRYVVSRNNDSKRKGSLYKLYNPTKYPSNPKKAVISHFDIAEKEPIKIASHIWKDIKNTKISVLKIDPKAVDEYGYKKIVSEDKGTIEKILNKYNVKYEIQE